jgi:succinate dehydrogenase/fumarate reductase flavoprotein subunit
VDDSAVDKEVEKRSTLFEPGSGRGPIRSATLLRKLREIMYRDVGVVRDRNGLTRAKKEIAELREAAENELAIIPGRIFNYDQVHAFELFNMLDLCQLVIQGAARREESRGAHYRRDYPATQDSKWLKNIVYRRREEALQIETVDVKTPYVQVPGSGGHE